MKEIPQTEVELKRYLRTVEKLRSSSDFPAALEACQLLISHSPTCEAGLRARADTYADMRDRESEVADRKALVELGSPEPGDYFDLGVALWRSGQLPEAAERFTSSIKLGEKEDFHFYTNASRMHLVALLIKLQREEEALRECLLVPDSYSSYLPDGMTTKEQLIEKLSK
ncbi:tetratricopeptide repeat protein [Dyella tabacisoli]|uniref:Tetratricopeptide repeat protein n=1 Tax=Dyella tabacisoli TaxID=2282381 RepID=A0A369UUA5_9GAMM|nr:hypothetical protein [Dyella tabacisoli]RDD83190.1 hypothetical protein DVJ77_00865 [Dyella tabacisoli]